MTLHVHSTSEWSFGATHIRDGAYMNSCWYESDIQRKADGQQQCSGQYGETQAQTVGSKGGKLGANTWQEMFLLWGLR